MTAPASRVAFIGNSPGPAAPEVREFDLPHYREVDRAREMWLRQVIDSMPGRDRLRTALDVGCGAGHFSGVLAELGFAVTGVDLRPENLAVCRQRYPAVSFEAANLDEDFELGTHDLVLMFGILYHLQSPLVTLQRLARSIGRVGIVSTRVASGEEMALYLFREHRGAAHNTAAVSAVPTLPALLALFRQAGLEHIYFPEVQPDHPEWRLRGNGRRHAFIVAREPLDVPGWRTVTGPLPLRKWQPRNWWERLCGWLRPAR